VNGPDAVVARKNMITVEIIRCISWRNPCKSDIARGANCYTPEIRRAEKGRWKTTSACGRMSVIELA